jgi:hypothetical protein
MTVQKEIVSGQTTAVAGDQWTPKTLADACDLLKRNEIIMSRNARVLGLVIRMCDLIEGNGPNLTRQAQLLDLAQAIRSEISR